MRIRTAMRSARAALAIVRREVVAPAVDFLYPPVCYLCDGPLDSSEKAVCALCWGRFAPVDAREPAWRELACRTGDAGVIDDLLACWIFESGGALKEAVHVLKYRRIRSLGRRMGVELGQRIARDVRFRAADLLVPVPLHRTRLRERGFNQCTLLCEGITEVTGIPHRRDLLRRTRHTESQTRLDPGIRRKNVAGAFRLDPSQRESCAGKTLILVDDVMTTGSTIMACGELLRQAGAHSVLAACVALAR